YMMNMLLQANDDRMQIRDVQISSNYINENESSHFDVVRDSIRIYKVFFKYIFASLLSCLVDIDIFTFLMMVFKGLNFGTVVIASVLARIVSSMVNFTLNRNLVFRQGR